MEKKICMTHWRRGQRREGGHSKFPTTEIEVKLGELDLEEKRVRLRAIVSLSASLSRMACRFPGNDHWSWRLK